MIYVNETLWNTKIKTAYNLSANKIKEVPKVRKTELEIKAIGEPDIKALPEAEQLTFFETLLARIKELSEQQPKQD